MIELTEQQKRAFYSQGYFNRYKMYFPDLDLTIDNETIHTESVKIEESICGNEDLTLGGCIASSCEFEVSEILQNDLSGMEFMRYNFGSLWQQIMAHQQCARDSL